MDKDRSLIFLLSKILASIEMFNLNRVVISLVLFNSSNTLGMYAPCVNDSKEAASKN